jgi:hypothetical protein
VNGLRKWDPYKAYSWWLVGGLLPQVHRFFHIKTDQYVSILKIYIFLLTVWNAPNFWQKSPCCQLKGSKSHGGILWEQNRGNQWNLLSVWGGHLLCVF